MSLIICPECSQVISDKSSFCIGCGAQLSKYGKDYAFMKYNTQTLNDAISFLGFKIEVVNFPDKMKWVNAKQACNNLGNGWRLPQREELNTVFENKFLLSRAYSDLKMSLNYWSADDFDEKYAWSQSFFDGKQKAAKKEERLNFFAINEI